MPIDYSKLKQELLTDPHNCGFASLIATGNHTAIADILNNPNGCGSGTIQKTYITSDVANSILEKIITNTALPPTTIQTLLLFWGFTSLPAANNGAVAINTTILNFLNTLQLNGTLSATDVQNITTRKGSYAEVLFGENTVVSYMDVAQALAS